MKLVKKLYQAKYAIELAKLITEARTGNILLAYLKANTFKSKVAKAVFTDKVDIEFYQNMFNREEVKDYKHFLDYYINVVNNNKKKERV